MPNDTPRVKLGETPLVRALLKCQRGETVLVRGHRDVVGEAGLWALDLRENQQWGRPALTPAGEALLAAADLWDSLPEPDPKALADLCMGEASTELILDWGLRMVAATLEAKRREKPDGHAGQTE